MDRSFQVRSFHDIVRSLEENILIKERPNQCIAEWVCTNALPSSFTVFKLTFSCLGLKVLKQILSFSLEVTTTYLSFQV